MKKNNSRCLLLNADFTPLSIIPWKRAVVWHMKYENTASYGIDIIDFYKNDCIHGVNQNFPIPAVAKTKKYFRFGSDIVTFSRKNIFVRDNYTCQYCSKKFEYHKLTYDHVVPKSANGPTTWTNIVTACFPCNSRKGNRTPKQADMPLSKQPIKPEKRLRYLPIFDYLATINSVPEEWRLYLPEY